MSWSDKPSVTYEGWVSERDGCIMCACGHGCNQWLQNNLTKTSLILRILYSRGSTSLDRIVQMENSKVDKIWHWLQMRAATKFNEQLRKESREAKDDQ